MTDLSEKIIEKIQVKTLKPKPRWQFRAKESGQWISVAALFLIVAFLASMFWLFVFELDIGLKGWLFGQPFFAGRALWLILLSKPCLGRKFSHGANRE